jgi:hypothetical protein
MNDGRCNRLSIHALAEILSEDGGTGTESENFRCVGFDESIYNFVGNELSAA